MGMTLFELKEKIATLNAGISADADWIAEKAADPSVEMKDITTKEAHRKELTARRDMLQAQHDTMEEVQRRQLERKEKASPVGLSEKEKAMRAKAEFYRAALSGGDMKKAYEGLGAIPTGSADLGHGEHLLPRNMSGELLTEPMEENTLRRVEPVSQINGLEETKLDFSIEDAKLADVTDSETAREIQQDASTISYGRFKTKIVATVKDTVLHGTDFDLVSKVESALRSGLAIKEKMNAFRTVSDTKHDHMSFYLNSIKEVEGDDLIQAVINAWADLPEMFAGNASAVMRKLANGAADLWGKKPEDVLGIPVVFNDRAVTPVVGDFRYSRQNYDVGAIYETDKDAKKGEYYFVLTAWGDHRIRLKSAFRLAKVKGGANP